MSAYVVENKTINKVLSHIKLKRDSEWIKRQLIEKTGFDVTTDEGLEQLGRALLLLNVQAVNVRYGNGDDATQILKDYSYRLTLDANCFIALKALHCLRYQCSEGDVPETDMYKTIEWLSMTWAEDIVRDIKAYDIAAWG